MKRSLASTALNVLGSILVSPPTAVAAGIPDHFYFVAGDRPPPDGGIQNAANQRRALTVDAIRRRLTMYVAVWSSVACVGLAILLCAISGLARHTPSASASPSLSPALIAPRGF